MHDFFLWLESLSLASWVRESGSIWAYPTVLCSHTFGMAIVAGLSAAVDLRILGFAPEAPLAPMDKVFPVMWVGFWINLVTGMLLLIADATTKFYNPVFYVKLGFVAIAVGIMKVQRKQILLDQASLSPIAKFLAIASIISWLGAITAGRLMAYLGPVGGLG